MKIKFSLIFRVEVLNNAVSILDVTFLSKPLSENSDQNDRLKKIKELIRTEEQILESFEARKSRLVKQKSVLDSFANNLIESNENNILPNGSASVVNQQGEPSRERVNFDSSNFDCKKFTFRFWLIKKPL